MKDINLKERLKKAEQAFSILSSAQVNDREKPSIVAKLAEAGKYRIELESLIYFNELEKLPVSKVADYLQSKIKDIDAERNKIKRMYNILEAHYVANKREDPSSVSNFAEMCQYDLSARIYAEKLSDKLDEVKDISPEDKRKKLEERVKKASEEKRKAKSIYDIAESEYRSLSREDAKAIVSFAEAAKYLNSLNMYIDNIDYQLLDKNKSKEYLQKLYHRRKEEIMPEKDEAKFMFNNIKAQYQSLNREKTVYLGKVASVLEYRSDILERLEKTEERIIELGGTVPVMSQEKIKAVLEENEQDVKTIGKVYNNIEVQYNVNNRMLPEIAERFAEVGNCLLVVEKKANRFKHKPANKEFYYEGDEDPQETARREQIRKKLVAEGEYIPSLKYLETASPKTYWVEQGLYGSKNPLGSEFQGVAADKRQTIAQERAVVSIKKLEAKNYISAAEYFNIKL